MHCTIMWLKFDGFKKSLLSKQQTKAITEVVAVDVA